MKTLYLIVLAVAGIGAAITASSAHERYGDDGYYGDEYYGGGYGGRYYDPYARPTDGYYGAPRFFRSWHDRVSGYDDAFASGNYAPYGVAGYLPESPGPYYENRGYGVSGRGWQEP